MTHNPPPLVSPVPGLSVRAVLDQDALVTAGLAVSDKGERALLLVGSDVAAPGGRREFLAWSQALADVGRVAPSSPIAGFGHTTRGGPTSPPTSRRRSPTGCGWAVRRHIAPCGSSRPRWPMYSPPRTPPESFMRRSARPRFSLMRAGRGWADSAPPPRVSMRR